MASQGGEHWVLFGRSVLGSSHERGGLPNQDAMFWQVREDGEPPWFLAVADGHGSASYFRSQHGARLAVEAALIELRAFLSGMGGEVSLQEVKRKAEQQLPERVLHAWRSKVLEHARANPIAQEEVSRLPAKVVNRLWTLLLARVDAEGSSGTDQPIGIPQAGRPASIYDIYSAYGSTLLAAAYGHGFLLLLQIGDGDFVVMQGSGVPDHPVPEDEDNVGNYTSSLAQQQARDKIRVRLLPLSGPPEMLLATTDGYPNSFPDVPSALDDVLADVRRLAGKHGEAWVEDNLGSWLREATEKGSGDDCTVVLALNTAAVARRREPETEPDNPPGEQPEGKTEGSEHGDAEEREHGPDQPVKD